MSLHFTSSAGWEVYPLSLVQLASDAVANIIWKQVHPISIDEANHRISPKSCFTRVRNFCDTWPEPGLGSLSHFPDELRQKLVESLTDLARSHLIAFRTVLNGFGDGILHINQKSISRLEFFLLRHLPPQIRSIKQLPFHTLSQVAQSAAAASVQTLDVLPPGSRSGCAGPRYICCVSNFRNLQTCTLTVSSVQTQRFFESTRKLSQLRDLNLHVSESVDPLLVFQQMKVLPSVKNLRISQPFKRGQTLPASFIAILFLGTLQRGWKCYQSLKHITLFGVDMTTIPGAFRRELRSRCPSLSRVRTNNNAGANGELLKYPRIHELIESDPSMQRVRVMDSGFLDFSKLTSLTRLELCVYPEAETTTKLLQLPQSLQCLKLTLNRAIDSAEYERLIDSIALGPKLKSLCLAAEANKFNAEALQKILKHQDQLTKLTLSHWKFSEALLDGPPVFHVSHPSLQSLPHVWYNSPSFVPLVMPQLRKITSSRPASLISAGPLAPCIEEITLKFYQPTTAVEVAKVLQHIFNRKLQLRQLSLTARLLTEFQSSRWFEAPQLHQLLSLELVFTQSGIQSAALGLILKSLPRIEKLVCSNIFPGTNLDWLHSKTLRHVQISMGGHMDRFDVTGSLLPSLEHIHLATESATSIRFISLKRIESVEIETSLTAPPLSLIFNECPKLVFIFGLCHLGFLRLRNLPHLQNLSLSFGKTVPTLQIDSDPPLDALFKQQLANGATSRLMFHPDLLRMMGNLKPKKSPDSSREYSHAVKQTH